MRHQSHTQTYAKKLTHHHNTSEKTVGDADMDTTADTSAPISHQPLVSNSSGLTNQHLATCFWGVSWANEMDTCDPMLDNDNPATGVGVSPVITTMSLMDWTN